MGYFLYLSSGFLIWETDGIEECTDGKVKGSENESMGGMRV